MCQWLRPRVSSLGRRQTIVGVEVPLATGGLAAFHQDVQTGSLLSIERLHHGKACGRPLSELVTWREEGVVGYELDVCSLKCRLERPGSGLGGHHSHVRLRTPKIFDAFEHCCCFALMDDETARAQSHSVVRGSSKQKVQSLCVPGARREHGPTGDHQYLIRGRISAPHRTFGETQLVIRNQDQSVHARLHRSEQYFTFSQSRAHALRHSNGSPQRSHVRGACPFFVRATRGP